MQGGWGEGSWERKFLGSDSSPTNSLLPLDPGTNGGVSIYALLIEMGCLACRVEDDSLGHEPGTLGKAKPASGQSPREQRTGLTELCIKPRDSQSPQPKEAIFPSYTMLEILLLRTPKAQGNKVGRFQQLLRALRVLAASVGVSPPQHRIPLAAPCSWLDQVPCNLCSSSRKP